MDFKEILQDCISSKEVFTNDTDAVYGFIADICTAISTGEIPRDYSEFTKKIAQALDDGVTDIEELAKIPLKHIRSRGESLFLKYPSAGPTHHMS